MKTHGAYSYWSHYFNSPFFLNFNIRSRFSMSRKNYGSKTFGLHCRNSTSTNACLFLLNDREKDSLSILFRYKSSRIRQFLVFIPLFLLCVKVILLTFLLYDFSLLLAFLFSSSEFFLLTLISSTFAILCFKLGFLYNV